MSSELRARVLRAIDDQAEDLTRLSLAIHGDPELGYDEHRASARLTAFLEDRAFTVRRGYGGLATSYRAERGSGGPVIAMLAEYDALPELGHACGHNLIALMGTAAAIGVAAVLGGVPGRVAAIGTPAEEGGGGKVALVRAGAFADVDLAMMVHPSSSTIAARGSLAADRVDVEFFGRAAHAAAQPDQGINALDGLIQTFNNVHAMRQQLRQDARVHGIVSSGGSAANVIPEYAMGKFSVRARDRAYQQAVLARFRACAEGAATATGTRLRLTVHENASYENMVPSEPLAARWAAHLTALGYPVSAPTGEERMGSTDMGNVSQAVPSIHPFIAAAPEGTPGHSVAFREAAATPEAHRAALAAAKALALSALDVLLDPGLLSAIHAEFAQRAAGGPVAGARAVS